MTTTAAATATRAATEPIVKRHEVVVAIQATLEAKQAHAEEVAKKLSLQKHMENLRLAQHASKEGCAFYQRAHESLVAAMERAKIARAVADARPGCPRAAFSRDQAESHLAVTTDIFEDFEAEKSVDKKSADNKGNL